MALPPVRTASPESLGTSTDLPRRRFGGAALLKAAAPIAAGLAALAFLAPGASYGDPAPSAADVTQKLDQLARQAEALTEQYNAATEDVAAKQQAADDAQRQAASSVADYAAARTQLTETVTSVYEGSQFGSAGALLLSGSGADAVDTLNTLNVIGAHRSEIVSDLTAKKTAADQATAKAAQLLADAKAKQAQLAKDKAGVESSIGTYKTTLASLTAADQAAYTNRDAATPAQVKATTAAVQSAPMTVTAGSANAQAAVSFALAQVGKPYVYAASGPNAYDCSGLTMASWARGGISLPHNAAAQYGYGRHVSVSQLVPGDLLFYYSPIGHVTIYVGNGMMVSAPQPGENVKLMPISAMMGDFVGATHLG